MNRVELIAGHPNVQAAIGSFTARLSQIIDLAIAIQQIPAPTFHEEERAEFVAGRFREVDLVDVTQDAIHNVYGRFPGRKPTLPPVVVSAHMDTVFPASADLTVRRKGRFVYGPGIGDNAAGVAGLLTLAQTIAEFNLQPSADLWFVGNVCEEGLGNLRGMQAVVERFGPRAVYVVVEGGLYGQISHQAIGVQRYRIEITAPGGHSWGSFGRKSAIHELGHLIAAIDRLDVPAQPKTTYNVGVIEGGTSINTIAQSAHMLLDLRSEDPEMLANLVQQVERLVARTNRRYQREGHGGVEINMTLIGRRPAGRIPRHTPLVVWAETALQLAGKGDPVQFIASSTDANVPLSQGITAVCIGLTESNNAHRLDEYLDAHYLPHGLAQLLLLVLAAADFSEIRE